MNLQKFTKFDSIIYVISLPYTDVKLNILEVNCDEFLKVHRLL